MSISQLASLLRQGLIGVLPTDTIYGVVAAAANPEAVLRLYRLRRKTPRKPFVILIGRTGDLKKFGVAVTAYQKHFLKKVWPGKVSVVLPCSSSSRFAYLHCGRRTLAFRMPRPRKLRALLRAAGPLAAPSANPEGEKPAETISQARRYFGSRVDFYVSAGKRMIGAPSTIVSLTNREPRIVRVNKVRPCKKGRTL